MIRKLLQYWLLTSFLMGVVLFIYSLIFLPANCRECPVIALLVGSLTGLFSLLTTLGYFLLLIPVRQQVLRMVISVIICLLPSIAWSFLFFINDIIDFPEEYFKVIIISSLGCGLFVFLRMALNKTN